MINVERSSLMYLLSSFVSRETKIVNTILVVFRLVY